MKEKTDILNTQQNDSLIPLGAGQLSYSTESLLFKVMGFIPTNQFDTLIATVKVGLNPHLHDEYTHVQKINLYDNDRLNFYCRNAAFHLKVNEAEVKKSICSLREKLERHRLDELQNLSTEKQDQPLSKKEIDQGREILKADNLMECLEGLLKQAGVITENENALRLFLILLSRHFDKPLHALLQGSPQLSHMLMDKITQSIPFNEIHEQTSMSMGAMYYTRDKDHWKNKVLFLRTIEKNFKGALTIKEFIENTVLKRQTTEADYTNRQLYASNKIVSGPICLLGYSEDEYLNNRFFQECFFIRIDESEANRTDMLNHIKKESAGEVNEYEGQQALRLLREIQRQIQPMKVVIPYAMELELPEKVFQPLRSLSQLLTFIKSVALLHQHQLKPKKDSNGVDYIEATPEHLEIALELFKSILIVQSDILSPNQRNFFERLKMRLKEDKPFKIPELIQDMRIGKSCFYRDFDSLKELGYIFHAGGNKKTGIQYRLAHWDEYQHIKGSMKVLDEQIKKIKELGFPQVSQKIPSKSKTSKT